MTRVFLRDWIIAHGCKIEVLNEYRKSLAAKATNPKTGGYVFLDLPIDKKPIKHFYACRVCIRLGIPLPNECEYLKELADILKKNHHPNKD